PLADHRAWRGLDPAVALLRIAAAGTAAGAPVLRQGAADAGRRHRTAFDAMTGQDRTMDNLRISLVQGDTLWHDPAGNRAYYGDLMAPLRGITDLVLLPETFTSGFSNDAIDKAEDMDGPTVRWMREQAAVLDAVVSGSVQLRDGAAVYNRMLWVRPDGRCAHYDKRHLFTYAREHERYAAGRERLVV